jgi:hypothetical protein
VAYNVLYNVTGADITAPLLLGLDSAVLALAAGGAPASFRAAARPFPQLRPRDFATRVVAASGGVFLVCPALFGMLLAMYQIASERERRLDAGLRANGMFASAYWCAWLLTHALLAAAGGVATVACGWMFGFAVFTAVDAAASLVLFVAFGLALLPLAYLLGVFVRQARTAAVVGFLVLVLGLFLQLVFAGDKIYAFYGPDTPPAVWRALQSFAPFAFGKCLSDMLHVVGPGDGVGRTHRFAWADWAAPVAMPAAPGSAPALGPAPVDALRQLVLVGAVLLVLFAYLEAVVPREGHPAAHPLFFLRPLLALCRRSPARAPADGPAAAGPAEQTVLLRDGAGTGSYGSAGDGADLEQQRRLATDPRLQRGLRIVGLGKTYTAVRCGRRPPVRLALTPASSFSVRRSPPRSRRPRWRTCFCLRRAGRSRRCSGITVRPVCSRLIVH